MSEEKKKATRKKNRVSRKEFLFFWKQTLDENQNLAHLRSLCASKQPDIQETAVKQRCYSLRRQMKAAGIFPIPRVPPSSEGQTRGPRALVSEYEDIFG